MNEKMQLDDDMRGLLGVGLRALIDVSLAHPIKLTYRHCPRGMISLA
jgi:hypothetical protein